MGKILLIHLKGCCQKLPPHYHYRYEHHTVPRWRRIKGVDLTINPNTLAPDKTSNRTLALAIGIMQSAPPLAWDKGVDLDHKL